MALAISVHMQNPYSPSHLSEEFKMDRRIRPTIHKSIRCLLLFCLFALPVPAAEEYTVKIHPQFQDHPAVVGMMNVLRTAMEHEGWSLVSQSAANADTIMGYVGPAELCPPPPRHPQGFIFSCKTVDGRKQWTVLGYSSLGAAAGLAWVADRIKVTGEIPESNVTRFPKLERHFNNTAPADNTLADPVNPKFKREQERLREEFLSAVQFGATDLLPYDRNELAWVGPDTPPESVLIRREAFREYIRIAHELGLRVFLVGDELIYRDEWLKAMNAELCTQDPNLWEVLREKLRSVLRAVPELDGILVRTGEIIPRGELKAFDLVHHRCEREQRSIELIYQQILKTCHGVIVGEFGKEYIHRTWVTSSHEQHSIAEVYERIFTDEIPTDNLIVSIKLTRTDQWQFQQLNPTFGCSPHKTNVEVETSRFKRGMEAPIMDFAAERVASGMQFALNRGAVSVSNAGGTAGHAPGDAARYMIWRFSWDPGADVREVISDWAATTFGRDHAQQVADVFLALDKAVRNAWYVRPLAVTHWNPSPHIYVDRFALKGIPPWDRGAGQDKFLFEVYLQCKPWIQDTLDEMDMGIAVWRDARDSFAGIADDLQDRETVAQVRSDLERGVYALQLNRAYIAAVFACYAYRENPTEEGRELLGERIESLKNALQEHNAHDPYYGTTPIEVFLDVAQRSYENPGKTERELKEAPTAQDVHAMIQEAAKNDDALLAQHPKAKTVFRWSGTLDGRDILSITEKEYTAQHFIADPIGNVRKEFLAPFPKDGQYVIRRLKGRGHIYMMEPPSPENNMTAKVLVDDPLPSSDVHAFELCVIVKE